jgi:hypothetical protein
VDFITEANCVNLNLPAGTCRLSRVEKATAMAFFEGCRIGVALWDV